MATDRSEELGAPESNDSRVASFTAGQFFRIMVLMMEIYAAENPDVRLLDICLNCMRNHLDPNAEVSCDCGDRRLWEQVSPDTPFLMQHLPPVLPLPTAGSGGEAAAGPSVSCAAASSVRIVHDHGPLKPTLDVGGLPHAGTSTSYSESLADTESVVESLDTMSGTVSPANSLYSTPEHVTVGLPNIPAAVAPARAAVVTLPAAPVAAVAAAMPPPAPAAAVAPAPAAAVAPAPAAAVAPAPAAAAAPAPVPAPGVIMPAAPPPAAAVPVAGPAPAPGAAPNYVAYIANDSAAENWYVVTRGRRVGVFDNSAMMVHAVARISGGSGRGGFHTRDAAIFAFRAAEAAGIVREVRPDE